MSWSAPIRMFIVAISLAGLAVLLPSTKVQAGIANHVVISEIQTAGDTANDEFIELYNPTSQPVDITGWTLLRKTGGGASGNIISSMTGIIQAYGFYLIAPDGYNGSTPRDAGYSNASNVLTGDNSVILLDTTDSFVDIVGMGSPTDSELFSTLDPIAGESVERKALPSSTNITMDTNGIHALLGNGEDSNNNGSDFTSRNIPQPQNSSSPIENPNIAQPTPTNSPTAAPTVAPSPTTIQPSPTGVAPSATPVPQVSPTSVPTPTVAPSPTPTPSGEIVMMDNQFMTCKKTYRTISIMTLTFRMPSFSCISK